MKRLDSGRSIGAFRIEAFIGAGGMGEVYRAQDTKLRRAVALKVLPDAVALDPERRTRFEQEARAVAALNHPNIGAIYGIEESDDVVALVLELVDGPTLADRLEATPLSTDETLLISRQLADAIEAAHDRGIIHRDLKPANIKITPDGVVKVLDFGLAKASGVPGRDAGEDLQTTRMGTEAGMVMGTAGYMSPEQARGLAIDKRTDIWAFGCIVYEMCARTPAFHGPTRTDTLAAVLEREPDWRRVPASTPAHLRRLLRRCLAKDPKQRLRDIGEARIALTTGADVEVAGATARRSPALLLSVIAVMVAVAAFALGRWSGSESGETVATATPIRFVLPPPEGGTFVRHPARTFLALSPDGTQLAYLVATDRTRVWLRSLANAEARPITGTEGAASMFWSPDSRTIAFFTGRTLKRVAIDGGAAVPICEVSAAEVMHGTWGGDGTILIGVSHGTAISRVSAAGGTPKDIITPDGSKGERRVHWPVFLPDSRRFLYTTRLSSGDGVLRMASIDGGAPIDLMPVTSNTAWVNPDVVVFVREGVLMGQRVDLAAARRVGEPFVVAGRTDFFFTTSRAMFSAAPNGAVAYHERLDAGQLTWLDATGKEVGVVSAPADYEYQSTRISSNGSAVLVARRQAGLGTLDVWRLDLARKTEQQLTDDRGSEVTPMWLDDERTLLFSADRTGFVPHLFRKDMATGAVTEVLPGGRQHLLLSLSLDRGTAVFAERTAENNFDILQLRLVPGGSPTPLVTSRLSKPDGRLSPDGRAIAFLAADRGEIYVAPVPVTRAPELIASGVGGYARWSRDGGQLFFIGPDRQMMSVQVSTTPTLVIGSPRRLFEVGEAVALHDVAPDGRFLVLVPTVRGNRTPLTVSLGAIPRGAK